MDAGYAIVLAFGRNDYPDESSPKRLGKEYWASSSKTPTVEEVAEWHRNFESDGVFEKLSHVDFDPGQPNEILAYQIFYAEDFLRWTSDIPMIVQWEVAYVLWKSYKGWYNENQEHIRVIWPEGEGYLSTYDFLREAEAIARTNGWHNPLIIAHPEHVQRAYFLAKEIYYLYETVRVTALSHSLEWFDVRSVQWWTRGPMRWLAYEMLARIHHRLKGWL